MFCQQFTKTIRILDIDDVLSPIWAKYDDMLRWHLKECVQHVEVVQHSGQVVHACCCGQYATAMVPCGVSACWCSRCAAVLNEGLSFRPGISMYFFDGWVYNYYVHDSTNLID